MPAFPARARAAIRSLLSRPHPSSARMSTATATNCSDSSALSGLPGVPVMPGSRARSSCAPPHSDPDDGVTTMTGAFTAARSVETLQCPERVSRPGGTLHVHLEAAAVVTDPPLVAGGGHHPLEPGDPVRVVDLPVGGLPQRIDVQVAGVGVRQAPEAGVAERLVGLLVG